MSKTYSSLGFDIPIEGLPKTVDEFNSLAGRDCCLDYAIQHYVAHNHLTKVRAAICAAVEEATGIEREKEENDGKTKYTESDARYIKRVESELPDGESLETTYLEPIIEAAKSVPVDLTKTVRAGGTSKTAQKWLDKASAIIEAGKLDAFCEAHDLTIDEDADEETILNVVGQKVRLVSLELQKQAEAQALGI